MNVVRLCIPLLIACMICGCGQKGPLLLPDAPKPKKVAPGPRVPAAPTPPSAAPAPASTPATETPGSPSDATMKP